MYLAIFRDRLQKLFIWSCKSFEEDVIVTIQVIGLLVSLDSNLTLTSESLI